MEQGPAGKEALAPTEEVGRSRWTWRRGPVDGPAVVFDLDGVLSNAAARQHFIKAPRPDWESFFSASADDPLVDEVAALLGLLAPALAVVLLTARPARTGPLTISWLARHDLRWDLLVTRQDALRDIRARRLDLKLGFEDDLRNVEMFRSEGVPCLYIHSGYYD